MLEAASTEVVTVATAVSSGTAPFGGRPVLAKERRPELDPVALRREVEGAKAELHRAAAVPVPDWDDEGLDDGGGQEEALFSNEPPTSGSTAASASTQAYQNGVPGEEQEEEEVVAPNGYGSGAEGPQVGETLLAREDEVCGTWISQKGECHIFEDHMTSQLSFEEALPDGSGRLHGFLLKQEDPEGEAAGFRCWQAEIALLEEGERPWYGPSFGEKPEPVGDIQVRFSRGSPPTLETRIRVAEEETDWEAPVTFRRRPVMAVPDDGGSVFVFGNT